MASAFLLCASCTKNFQQINQSADFVSTPNIDFELPYVELTMIDNTYYTQGDYVAPLVGQVTQQKTYINRITPGDETGGLHWKWIYQNPLKNVVDLMSRTKGDSTKVNYYNIGRIIKVYLAATLTDTYGDMPYFQAAEGYTNQVFQPAFDAQQDIYADMFNELQQAATALNVNQPVPTTSDIVYKGDVTKWRKFAYGMMLRLGLRIYKADPVNSAKWINAAIAGGLPASNADNFVVNYLPASSTGSASNPTVNGQPWIFINYPTKYRLTKPFVDFLVTHNDPRTPVYCMLPGNATKYAFGDTVSAHQKGYIMFGTDTAVTATVNTFSTSNILTFGRLDAPYMHLSYAQVQYQLAECVVRGIISGDAKTYYQNGVAAAMTELSIYNTSLAISTAAVNSYLAQNPYAPASTEDALNIINTQYWIETHYNWYEGFANMRRSGYPKIYDQLDLTFPANQGATLPHRLTYPPSEVAANPHAQDAIKRQGADICSTHVWWDK
ncbi:hypothetical protein F5148DRAFT_1295351 [Russula earlei]|uniref:Uncharacterized protein n=1 Tax=Russula earlei TaxID=71964 RepID=A0ACC0TSE1_9AGAM|nr:hypothetical protein F5148DRAFT_1295351 [Russula earlei]